MKKVLGIVIVASALLIAGVAQLNNCQYEGKSITVGTGATSRQIPMKCYWTAQAELVTGGSLLLVGGLIAFGKRRESRRDLAILGTALGAFTMLLPTALIGVCTTMTASCNLVMRPAMLLLGAVVIAASIGSLLLPGRRLETAG